MRVSKKVNKVSRTQGVYSKLLFVIGREIKHSIGQTFRSMSLGDIMISCSNLIDVNNKYDAHLAMASWLRYPLPPVWNVQQLFAICVSCAVRAAALMNGLLTIPDTDQTSRRNVARRGIDFPIAQPKSLTERLSFSLGSDTRGCFRIEFICMA